MPLPAAARRGRPAVPATGGRLCLAGNAGKGCRLRRWSLASGPAGESSRAGGSRGRIPYGGQDRDEVPGADCPMIPPLGPASGFPGPAGPGRWTDFAGWQSNGKQAVSRWPAVSVRMGLAGWTSGIAVLPRQLRRPGGSTCPTLGPRGPPGLVLTHLRYRPLKPCSRRWRAGRSRFLLKTRNAGRAAFSAKFP